MCTVLCIRMLQKSSLPWVCDVLHVSSVHYCSGKPRKINYFKGKQNICVSIRPLHSDDVRVDSSILHLIDFQTLLICDGGFSMDESTIHVLLPTYNGTIVERWRQVKSRTFTCIEHMHRVCVCVCVCARVCVLHVDRVNGNIPRWGQGYCISLCAIKSLCESELLNSSLRLFMSSAITALPVFNLWSVEQWWKQKMHFCLLFRNSI